MQLANWGKKKKKKLSWFWRYDFIWLLFLPWCDFSNCMCAWRHSCIGRMETEHLFGHALTQCASSDWMRTLYKSRTGHTAAWCWQTWVSAFSRSGSKVVLPHLKKTQNDIYFHHLIGSQPWLTLINIDFYDKKTQSFCDNKKFWQWLDKKILCEIKLNILLIIPFVVSNCC